MARILSGADFGVVMPRGYNPNFGADLSAQLLGQAMGAIREEATQTRRLENLQTLEKQRNELLSKAEAEKTRLNLLYTEVDRIKNMDHSPAKRAAIAKLGISEFNAGRDGSEFIEALKFSTPDEFNMNLDRLSTKAGTLAQQVDSVLASNAPASPLSPQGKLQADINEGILTKEQAKGAKGNASAISDFLEGGGARRILPDGREEITNRFGDVVTGQDAVDVLERSAKIVADREKATQDLRVDTERDLLQLRKAEKTAGQAFDMVDKLRRNIANLEQVTPLIGQGANTGPISQMFPSLKAATVRLENLQKRLGLDVVGAVTFGALSKGELDLAKAVAIPLGLEGDELIEWTNDTIAAKRKLASYFEDQAIFLSNGGTQAEWLENQKAELQATLGGATEADIRKTMRDNDMTRPQVLKELKRRRANGS